MRIQASKVLCKELNKIAKSLNSALKFEHLTLTTDQYKWHVGDVFTAADYGDYNFGTGLFRAIQVTYPPEYYAMPGYITTRDLMQAFITGDNWETYAKRVIENYSI